MDTAMLWSDMMKLSRHGRAVVEQDEFKQIQVNVMLFRAARMKCQMDACSNNIYRLINTVEDSCFGVTRRFEARS